MFTDLKKKVQDNFNKMSKGDLFYVAIDRDEIWRQYILGFPEAERQEHECNCCKSFLRQWSGIVSIIDGERVSIWDDIEVEGYTNSVSNVAGYIHRLPITDVFLSEEANCGTDKNFDSKREVTWEHFNITLPAKFVNNRDIDVVRGEKRTDFQVLQRALREIPSEVTETVLELIAQNSLYKGPEYRASLILFLKVQKALANKPEEIIWSEVQQLPQSVARIRSSSIGQLLINLSEGMELDTAVAKFEQMVAPTNYKRPTALVTPKMVEQAKEKLESLGLTGSLDRRYANESDLNAENILYVDKSSALTDVFGEISKDAKVNPRTFSKVEEVSMQDFIEKILPGSKSIEVLLENRHMSNMVSLLTANDKDVPSLFKWNNPFSWNYTGGITDSIKERVKAAGGKVDGVLRVSLSWFNYDDLDLHVVEPNGERISFMNRRSQHSGGELDVDMNAGARTSRTPVENITWSNESKMQSGIYEVRVNNYSKRETVDVGYDIQIEYAGEIFDISVPASPRGGATDQVIKFEYHPKTGIKLDAQSTVSNKEKWGLKTNQFHKVKNIMLSPSHWERPVGNKHFLFFLENCISDEAPRPFFNEFLKDEFTENRKVFEILGSKVKVEPTQNQLSGVGFSDTNKNNIIVKVTGQFTRTIKIYV